MNPSDTDGLTDEVWDAMVRRLVREAEAIEAANAKLSRR
jgi:hypothetical protein